VVAAFEQVAKDGGSIDILVNNVWAATKRCWRTECLPGANRFGTAYPALGCDVPCRVRAHYICEPASQTQSMVARRCGLIVKHFVLGGAKAHRKRRLWGVQSGDRQDDRGYGRRTTAHGVTVVSLYRGLVRTER